eukprot:CAMPEP_0113302844 /NCGR_PEP_ID=MMETSP0010_2-20120614/3503_1 /TAXON_ID=216773 ORGANISM="Corethron hystrix, Strain 308" /NCGR_SAMPLE_ID=MMETSP0010_2 /ASSEMBLY_ACC=CAM_ASM_000155 /LENGTH=297 /DNA_ID=CAMNT_0000156733 /DNA_START=369 /DNA_END=1262 /DNA_ORIENTATION=+ /assembly_acc=CAM_ASM_000155
MGTSIKNNLSLESFNDLSSFTISRELEFGKGIEGKVHLAHSIQTNQKFVIKSTVKSKDLLPDREEEIDILRSLQHDNIISLRGIFESDNRRHMIMDFMDGGDIHEDLHKNGRYTDSKAKKVAIEILKAVNYCHDNNIVHRDLKPENILLHKDDRIKIADFGWSTRISSPYSLKTKCGTFSYQAPEVLLHLPYGKPIDLWSIGVILYVMLGGYHPFRDSNDRELDVLVIQGKFMFHECYWHDVTSDGKALIRELLTKLPTRRSTAQCALRSKWIKQDERSKGLKRLRSLRPFSNKDDH